MPRPTDKLCYLCREPFSTRNKGQVYCSIRCRAVACGEFFEPPSLSAVRFAIFARDNFRCVYCGTKAREATLEIDHSLAIIDNGPHEVENVVTSCHECNGSKGMLRLKPETLQMIWTDAFTHTNENLRKLFEQTKAEFIKTRNVRKNQWNG